MIFLILEMTKVMEVVMTMVNVNKFKFKKKIITRRKLKRIISIRKRKVRVRFNH